MELRLTVTLGSLTEIKGGWVQVMKCLYTNRDSTHSLIFN